GKSSFQIFLVSTLRTFFYCCVKKQFQFRLRKNLSSDVSSIHDDALICCKCSLSLNHFLTNSRMFSNLGNVVCHIFCTNLLCDITSIKLYELPVISLS